MKAAALLVLGGRLALPASADDSAARWTPTQGITERVDVITARDLLRVAMEPGCTAFPDLVGELEAERRPRPNRPDAPAAARWPPATATVVPGGQTLSPQTIGLTFVATFGNAAAILPPDTMGAVGPTQILVATNNRVRVFDKNGSAGPLDVSLGTFFGSVSGGFLVGDPQARFDRLSGRFFLTAITFPDPNRVLIAVSSGATISGASSFTFFWFQQSQVSPPGDPELSADFDSLGVDRNALYIGVHIVSFTTGEFIEEAGFVVSKADLLAGTLSVTAFRGLGQLEAGMACPRGVQNDDPQATTGYFIGTDAGQLGRLALYRIDDPGGAPTISSLMSIDVPATSESIPQVVRGSPPGSPLASVPYLLAAEIRRNRITGARSLWTAQTVEVNEAGVAVAGGGRNGTRWYEIGNLDGTPALVQAGTLFDPAPSAPRGYWMATVTSTGQGHMALGASFASPNDYAGVAVAGRLREDPPGLTQAPTLARQGTTAYNAQSGEQLWGDYSQTVVDPADDQTVWVFQEFGLVTNYWGLFVAQLRAPRPATPSNASPGAVCVGSASTLVSLTGTSIAGSEFFDPGPDLGGPGFPRRIAASAPTVVVNGVTFLDPTHVLLDLSTVAAAPGHTDVTVINPDLQSRTGAGILNVLAEGAVCDDGNPTTCGDLCSAGACSGHFVAEPSELFASVRLAKAFGETTIYWDDAPGPYNVYRGVHESGVPWTYDHTCLSASTSEPTVADSTNPTAAGFFYYIVARVSECRESVVGRNGAGAPVPTSVHCME